MRTSQKLPTAATSGGLIFHLITPPHKKIEFSSFFSAAVRLLIDVSARSVRVGANLLHAPWSAAGQKDNSQLSGFIRQPEQSPGNRSRNRNQIVDISVLHAIPWIISYCEEEEAGGWGQENIVKLFLCHSSYRNICTYNTTKQEMKNL